VIVVGVPVITQVDERLSPVGSEGEELQEVTGPPAFVGVSVDIAEFFGHEKGLPE
jgi:hypothetical protein